MEASIVRSSFEFEGFTLDLARGCLRAGDRQIDLRPKSFDVLCHLLENAGRLVSKDELVKTVWPNVFVADDALTHCISEVRMALGDGDQRIVKTVPRRGYLLVAPVSLRATDSGPTTLPVIAPSASQFHSEAPSNVVSPKENTIDREQTGQPRLELGPTERRQLTVMACELVGLAALSTRLDPEDLHTVTAAAYRYCTAIIERYHGYVARYLNDGVLAYFGYPGADEDDAEHAVRAGLALVGSEAKLSASVDAHLRIRIGIASGIVVIREELAAGQATERIAVGEAPTLADRLRTIAAAGSLIIAHSTRRLVGGLFDYRDLRPVTLDGYTEPVRACEVLAIRFVESRFDVRQGVKLTPLVGRGEELEMLRRRWRQACKGEGRVVLVSGEPGIGKSRLTVALQELLQAEPHTPLRYFCSPHHTDSALFPIINQLKRAAAFDGTDPPALKLAKLEALFDRSTGFARDDVPFVADLLSLPIEGRYRLPETSSQKRRERTLAALVGQVESLARQHPVLLVYEDAHWIDPTTRELLEMTVQRIALLPVLLVVTFRPEFLPPWIGQAHVTLLTVNRLCQREAEALVGRVAGSNALSEEVTAQITRRADGIPLFVEELTTTVLETGDGEGDATPEISAGLLPKRAVPATLRASLMARLDRLGPAANKIAQISAAIGREFSYKVVAELAGYDPARLIHALRELETSGLIYARGIPPGATWTFKHALVQAAAYSTLLRGQRQMLHARIVAALETQSRDTVETQPELMAQHCAAAGLVDRAVMYWGRASQRAIARFALTEAIAHLTKALGLLRDLASTKERKQQELGLQIALGEAFIASKGHGAGETGQAFARAYQLGREIGDAPQLFHVLAGMFVHHHVRAEVGRSQKAARELLRLAEEQGDVAGQVMAHRALGDSLLHVGRLSSARAHLEEALSLFGPGALPVIVGEEIGVAALAFLSLCLAVLGFPTAAAARSGEALERARCQMRHPHTLAFALNVDCRLQWILRNPRRLQESSEELSLLAAEHRLKYMRAQGAVYRGCALALAGRFADAAILIGEGVAGVRATGAVWLLPFNRSALVIAYQRTGRMEEARSVLDEALELMRQTRVEWNKAELYRLEADFALSAAVPNLELAHARLCEAISTAQRQGAKWWELRATTDLARSWRDQGKRSKARDLLAPVHTWFTEGFDTPDLKDAKALLDELA
jgi:class 3 adenylate cyclase/DNA-binding winged helix-turn-helix (wHTH) protein/predicted ATPase